jgi:hypothetical protein
VGSGSSRSPPTPTRTCYLRSAKSITAPCASESGKPGRCVPRCVPRGSKTPDLHAYPSPGRPIRKPRQRPRPWRIARTADGGCTGRVLARKGKKWLQDHSPFIRAGRRLVRTTRRACSGCGAPPARCQIRRLPTDLLVPPSVSFAWSTASAATEQAQTTIRRRIHQPPKTDPGRPDNSERKGAGFARPPFHRTAALALSTACKPRRRRHRCRPRCPDSSRS